MIDRIGAVPYQKKHGELQVGNETMCFTERVPSQADRTIGKTVLAFHGIFAGESSLSPFARSLAQSGVVTVTAASRYGVRNAAEELAILKHQVADKFEQPVVLAGHSLGAIFVEEAALMSPEDLELLLMQPAGFAGVRVRNAIKSVMGGRPDNSHIEHELKLLRDGIRFGWHNKQDLLRLIHRATSLEGKELAGMLPGSITKSAIEFPDDTLISSEKSRIHLLEAGFAVHSLRTVQAGHNAQAYHWQDVADFTTLIINDGILSDIENNRLEVAA